MSWEAVGEVMGKAATPGARVEFSDGHRASVVPRLKVMEVTSPEGKTCSLKSREAAPYLAAMCDDPRVVDTFRRHLGAPPWEVVAPRPEMPLEAELPAVAQVKHIDVYV